MNNLDVKHLSEIDKLDAYWRASNYLSACQLYLLDNPLLERPLTKNDIKNVMSSLHEPLAQEEVDELMKTWDLDKDGYLNFEEFKNMMIQS